jgi:hypothetical protein
LKPVKIVLSERALLERVKRALAKQGERILLCQETSSSYHQLGDFYRVDARRNCIVEMDVDREAAAKELGCLKPWASLEVSQ